MDNKAISTPQRPTSLGSNRVKRQDFPAEGIKGTVAVLRSKFGNANTTDTNQIFGVNRGIARSKTVHASSIVNPSSNNKYVTPAHSQKPDTDIKSLSPGTLRVIQNNNNNNGSEKTLTSREVTPKQPRSPQNGNGTPSHAREFLINALPSPTSLTKTSPVQCANNNSQTSVLVDPILKSNGISVNQTRQSKRLSPTNTSTSIVSEVTTPIQPVFRSVSCLQSRSVPANFTNFKSRSPNTNTTGVNLQGTGTITPTSKADLQTQSNHTQSIHTQLIHTQAKSITSDTLTTSNISTVPKPEEEKTNFTSTVSITMADPALVDKYSHITDMEELTAKLKDTRDFEERRALRAAIRKLRNASPVKSDVSHSTEKKEDNSSSLDLGSYTTEEDLKILLHQTTNYDDKKRIRAAIRDIRKKSDVLKGEAVEPKRASDLESSVGVQSTPEKVFPAQRSSTQDVVSPPPTPSTPDVVSILKNMSNDSTRKDVIANTNQTTQDGEETTQDDDHDILVSPIKHESRTLLRPDGNIQIETYSKHSRTTSQSDVYEKSTKVTKTSTVGDLEISEKDEIVTKEKLSLKGSITAESDLIRKVDIKEKGGSQVIEEEITLERTSQSKTSGTKETSAVQVSILREKHPPCITKDLVDMSGADGDRLVLTCELEVPSGDNGNVDVTWLKDDKKIKANKDMEISWKSPVATLEIKELLYPDDSGCYTCQAKNKHGIAESSAAITVKEVLAETSLKFSTDLSDISVIDGDLDVTLTCKLSERNDDVNVTWYKKGKIIKNSSEFKQTFDGEKACLVISEVFPEDSGEYECLAIKGALELSSYCSVKVQDAPKNDVEIITKTAKGDTNNNSCKKEETTPAATEKASNGVAMGETDVGKSEVNGVSSNAAVEKCEERLKDASIADDFAAKQDVTDAKSESISENSKNTSKPSPTVSKPALKSVPKSVGMSRPGGKSSSSSGSKGAMAAFKQMDTANNPNAAAAPKPNYMRSQNASTGAGLQRSATTIKQMLLDWCKHNTKEYENVSIDNFSTSWNTGVAFLALIHHFYPDSFEWEKVDERRRRENFTLAFDIAEKKADIAPLLDVEDMVRMKKPDWKCVFTYVQSFYRKLREHENNKHTYVQQ